MSTLLPNRSWMISFLMEYQVGSVRLVSRRVMFACHQQMSHHPALNSRHFKVSCGNDFGAPQGVKCLQSPGTMDFGVESVYEWKKPKNRQQPSTTIGNHWQPLTTINPPKMGYIGISIHGPSQKLALPGKTHSWNDWRLLIKLEPHPRWGVPMDSQFICHH